MWFGWCLYNRETVKLHVKAARYKEGEELKLRNLPVNSVFLTFYGTSLNRVRVRLSSGRANRVADPGAAALPVPPVQPADGSGPGSAAE